MEIQLFLRDLLFINYAVEPERLRPFVPDDLVIDTLVSEAGKPVALVSAVAFRVTEVRSAVLPFPSLSFEQVNYRAYVRREGPAVYFFDMRINSRLITSMTSFLRMPVSFEEIEIATEPVLPSIGASEIELADEPPSPNSMRCRVASSGPRGLQASVVIGAHHEGAGPEGLAVPADYITERPIGYATVAGDSLYKITADHDPIDSLAARVESVKAPALSSLGILNLDETTRPHSVLYARAALFETKVPRPISEH